MEIVILYKTTNGIFLTKNDALKNRASFCVGRYGNKEHEQIIEQPALKSGDKFYSLCEIETVCLHGSNLGKQ